MAAAAAVLRAATIQGDRLVVDGSPLLAETVRAELRDACAAHGAPAPADVIVASVWQGFGHEAGTGPLPAAPADPDRPLAARRGDRLLGGHDAHLRRRRRAPTRCARRSRCVAEAFAKVKAAARPGVTGRELHALACDVFEAAGHRTQRTGPGDDPNEGFQFSLGHGVGLEIHEDPGLGQSGRSPLVPGDVIAIEPGLWEREIGGVRYEDLLLITEDGCETLTQLPVRPDAIARSGQPGAQRLGQVGLLLGQGPRPGRAGGRA